MTPKHHASPPSVVARAMMGVVKAYRLLLSAWIGNACRFEPTCSIYALQAIEAHGAARGGYLAAHRILRCNPWCQAGHDPVPQPSAQATRFALFTRLKNRADS